MTDIVDHQQCLSKEVNKTSIVVCNAEKLKSSTSVAGQNYEERCVLGLLLFLPFMCEHSADSFVTYLNSCVNFLFSALVFPSIVSH